MGHLPFEELLQRQCEAAEQIPVGSRWEHYATHDTYRVFGHCILEASDEAAVMYRSEAHPEINFVKAVCRFLDEVVTNNQVVARFRQIN